MKDCCQQVFIWGHSKSRNAKWKKKKGKSAVGTGPAAAGPILANQPAQKCHMSFGELFESCSKRTNTSRDLARELSYERFLVGDGGKHTLLPEERPC